MRCKAFIWRIIYLLVFSEQLRALKVFNVVGFFEKNTENSLIMEDRDARGVFESAVKYTQFKEYLAETDISLSSHVFNITSQDVFKLSQQVCQKAVKSLMVGAALGVKASSLKEYLQIVSNIKKIPYMGVTPSQGPHRSMVVHLHPSARELLNLVRSLIKYPPKTWNWNRVFIVFESTSEMLPIYLELLALHRKHGLEIASHHIEKGDNYTKTFEYIRSIGTKAIIVDCSLNSINSFLEKALEMQMLTSDYHYHFTSLDLHVLDLSHYSYGGSKITWSQLVNWTSESSLSEGLASYDNFLKLRVTRYPPKYYFTTHNALIVDSLLVLSQALDRMSHAGVNISTQSLDCALDNDTWVQGQSIIDNIIQHVTRRGVTGDVQFNSEGQRVNYTMYLMKLLPGGSIENIGECNSSAQRITFFPDSKPQSSQKTATDLYEHRVLNVTTLIEPPYLTVKTNRDKVMLAGNERYQGYLVDLMERIAEEALESSNFELKYNFELVGDGMYGSEDPVTGEWNGMVRELLDRKADMAVAPLTINYERERVVDFTKPFMTFGIAILYKQPEKEPPHMLSFMEPINIEVWGTITVSVLVISFSMYIFSRFSPTEWENPYPCQDNYEYLENQFNLSNALWFSVGSIMQQGCDIMPKAPSTRIIAISWWLFTLIIISSYTANLAAFLTITTLSDTFESVDELAEQTAVPYGCTITGNTCMFFNKSNIPVYQTMWDFMKKTRGAFTNSTQEGINKVKGGKYAFLMESSSIQYQVNTDPDCKLTQVGPPLNGLSYGIALRDKDPLREILSNTILRLNERQVLLELYNKWWKVDDNKCKLKESEGVNLKLKLKNLEGIFVFLMGGLAVAGVVLCGEVLLYGITRSKKERVSMCSLLSSWLQNSVKGTFPDPSSDNLNKSVYLPAASSLHSANVKGDIKHSTIEEETEPNTTISH